MGDFYTARRTKGGVINVRRNSIHGTASIVLRTVGGLKGDFVGDVDGNGVGKGVGAAEIVGLCNIVGLAVGMSISDPDTV